MSRWKNRREDWSWWQTFVWVLELFGLNFAIIVLIYSKKNSDLNVDHNLWVYIISRLLYLHNCIRSKKRKAWKGTGNEIRMDEKQHGGTFYSILLDIIWSKKAVVFHNGIFGESPSLTNSPCRLRMGQRMRCQSLSTTSSLTGSAATTSSMRSSCLSSAPGSWALSSSALWSTNGDHNYNNDKVQYVGKP